jgi:hypothetical protein
MVFSLTSNLLDCIVEPDIDRKTRSKYYVYIFLIQLTIGSLFVIYNTNDTYFTIFSMIITFLIFMDIVWFFLALCGYNRTKHLRENEKERAEKRAQKDATLNG